MAAALEPSTAPFLSASSEFAPLLPSPLQLSPPETETPSPLSSSRELQETVRILKNDEEFQDKGIYCPKGVLLHGPPGTGKTLLAKAIAGEAGLPFFAANDTDFVEMFVGVAASRVKDLFASARSFTPSIIFIDEIDAIGSKRGGPDIGGVLVIGATNRLDILDPALLRKGRFDKIIRFGLPSKDGRYAILKVHARNKFFRSEEVKETLLQEIAELTEDFTGAELQNILNEAGILTARKDLDYIGREELLEALKRQKGTFETGQEDSTEMPEELRLRLAYRGSAVAVLACYFPDPYRPISETDIKSISSQPNMRYTEISGKVFSRKSDFVNAIVRACAPRVIEEEMFGVDNLCWISAKATLEASRRAEFLILQTGMTAYGKAYYRNQSDLVPNLAAKLEALRDEYMRYAVDKCSSVLREYHSAVETITDILLDKGEIKAEEIWDIYNRAPRMPQPAVNAVDEYGALVYAGRWGIHGITLPGSYIFTWKCWFFNLRCTPAYGDIDSRVKTMSRFISATMAKYGKTKLWDLIINQEAYFKVDDLHVAYEPNMLTYSKESKSINRNLYDQWLQIKICPQQHKLQLAAVNLGRGD
ncbi:hypothetical protein ACLB2K_007593 [Fragaria x ananassa]